MQGTAEFQIIGRIGKINEVGTALKVDIASDYPRKKDGEWESNTHWNTVTLFKKSAEWVKTNCNPGDLVHVTGRLRNGSYDRDGQTIYTVDVIADRFHRLAEKQMPSDNGQE